MPGSRKGIPNKNKEEFRVRMRRYCEENGCDPHIWMADVLKRKGIPYEIKMQAAKELAQYLESKMRTIEVTGDPGKPVTHSLSREDRQSLIAALLEKRGAINPG